MVDYRYSLTPLSAAGSLANEGGRFNIGRRLSPGSFRPFSALYIAEDYDTAHHERFGQPLKPTRSSLTDNDLALRRPSSFTQVRLRGQLANVLDIGDLDVLKPLVGVIRNFSLPREVSTLVRQLGLKHAPWLIRSPITLQRQLLNANWRVLPMH